MSDYYNDYYSKKYPKEYNQIKKAVGNLFEPYTTMSHYDEVLYDPSYGASKGKYANIVEMTPDRYIDEAYKGFYGQAKTYDTPIPNKERMINGRLADTSMDALLEMNKAGQKYWLPTLEYGKDYKGRPTFSQEGLHRALTLKRMGIDSMPVVIQTEGDTSPKKNILKALRFSKTGTLLKTALPFLGGLGGTLAFLGSAPVAIATELLKGSPVADDTPPLRYREGQPLRGRVSYYE